MGPGAECHFRGECDKGHASAYESVSDTGGPVTVQCLQGKQIYGVELFRISLKN